MSEKKINSQTNSKNNQFSNNDDSPSQSRSNAPGTTTSSGSNINARKISIKDGHDLQLYDDYEEESSMRSVPIATNSGGNISRGREMSEGAVSNGPAMSEGGRSEAPSQQPGMMSRQMSEGAASMGPTKSEGGRSEAQSQQPGMMSRQMSEGAASMGPTKSEGGRSEAQSQQPGMMSRQMSEGAASMGPTKSEGRRSEAQSQQQGMMSRQMSEGAASMGPTKSEGGRSEAQSQQQGMMSRQMSEGAASMAPAPSEAGKSATGAPSGMVQSMSREGAATTSKGGVSAVAEAGEGAAMSRQMSEGTKITGQSSGAMGRQMSEGAASVKPVMTNDQSLVGDQPGFTNNYLNRQFSEGKSTLAGAGSAPLAVPNESIEEPLLLSQTNEMFPPMSNFPMMPIGPPFMDESLIPQIQSLYNQQNAAININRSQIPAVAETQKDKDWISKFEHFTVKFLNKIFRRALNERKMKEAVQVPASCKNANFNPTGQQLNPYYSYPANPPPSAMPGQQGFGQNSLFQPPPPVKATSGQRLGNEQQAPSEKEEEATIVSELNAMLDDISKDIKTISPEYLSLVTPLFGILVELKGKDFRKTDNREIFRKVDDYHALIKCDTHVCLESVMSRLQSLVEFINVIKTDSDNLRKFPRIITKCYETDSKICQEVCEVYSDDEFQTVNIKKMCKLKPKPPERPPWRLTYKIGDECFGSGKVQTNTCSAPAPAKACPLTGPARFSGAKTKSCGSKSRSTTCSTTPCCSSLGSKAAIRRYRSALYNSSLNKKCPCGCCDSTDKIPDICGIRFTRFRDVREEDSPLMLEGLPTNEIFPSFTNFDNKRQLNIPQQRLFLEEPKCYNPPPFQENCFGGKGNRWKKKFPCGGRNACCKDPCGNGSRRRRGKSCCKKNRRKNSALAECQTSEVQFPPMPPPGGGAADGVGDMSTLTPGEFSAKMVDMFGRAVEEGERAAGYRGNGTSSKNVADLARGLFGSDRGTAPATGGYNMGGMVATQTMTPGSRQPFQQQTTQEQQNYVVQMMQAFQHDAPGSTFKSFGQQTHVVSKQSKTKCRSRRPLMNKQAQTFQPTSSCKTNKASSRLPLKFSLNLHCGESQGSRQSCQSYQTENHNETPNQLYKTLKMSNNQLAGMLAQLALPPRPPAPNNSSSQQVFTNFVAQMYAAGNISKDDASRMTSLILRRQDDEVGTSGGGGGGRSERDPATAASSLRPQSATKGAQCTISQVQQMSPSEARLNCAKSSKTVHICGPEDGCGSSMVRDGQSMFTSTQVYTSASGTQLKHTRSYHGPGGSYSQSMLCITASKPSAAGIPRCDSQHRPVCATKSKRSNMFGIPPCNSQLMPACATKSKPSMMGLPRCKSKRSRKNLCVTKSQPSCAGIPRCPSATKSKPACMTKSKPSMPGVARCKSRPVCVTNSQPSIPGLPRCVPAVPLTEPINNDESDHGGGDEPELAPPPPQEDVPPYAPEEEQEIPPPLSKPPEQEVGGGREEDEENKTHKSSVLTPKSNRSPKKSERNTSPQKSPPLSDTPSPQASPVLSSHTQSSAVITPGSERSASISSRSPSLPPQQEEEEGETTEEEEEELEWPSTPPRGPLEKKPSTPPEPPSPPPKKTKPGKNYHSPFKFNKVRVPDPPCETVLCDLPECHPLKTPYPPQYRFDEVRMRRYMEQCHQLKKICSHPQGEQCWTPPPPPLPPELREKKPPFPPDRCHPPLFPGTNLGMGCSYGLPSGNCYGQYEKGRQGRKPEDCFFDCGGICPMGMLGETCPEQPPPYSKLKKKTKKDEVFQFDYITVMREKTGPPEPEGDYCDQLKRQRRLEEKQMMEAMAAADQCPQEETLECSGRRGRSSRRRARNRGGGCCMPDGMDPDGPPPPSQQITRFLQRPDVQVVKEQKTEIVKKQGMEGREKMVTQMEAYYTKTADGRISTELKDASNNNPGGGTVDQWMRQDADATLRKHNRGHRFTEECPVLESEWEKEFKEFAKSCGRSKSKGKQKPLPPGFIPCPLPERTTIMCRVPDPSSMTPGGNNVIQCQAVPIPTGNVGNAMQFGTEGVCVGGNSGRGGGANGMAGLSFVAPPMGYGGYVLQQPLQQTNQMFPQGLPPQQQQAYQALMSGFPGGVLPPPPPQQQQYQQQMYSQQPLQQQQRSLESARQQQLQQQSSWNADSPPPPPNGYQMYAPSQPVISSVRTTSDNKVEDVNRRPQETPMPTQPATSSDYPYMCEIRYHEPIHGSIYGRVVTRNQPCRLIDPNMKIPPGHNPNCPVIMETPFFNPSCRQRNQQQLQPQQPDPREEMRKQ